MIRPAGPDDNAALLDLTSACPMQADVSLLIEREPDFFALSEARGVARVVVAEEDGRIVACASASRRRGWIAGEIAEIGTIADVKVRPTHRRQRLAQRLLDALAAAERDEPPAVFVGLTAAGNAPVDGMVDRFGEGRPLVRLGELTSWQLLPLWRLRVPGDVAIARATPGDEAELVELLDAFHRERTFAPAFAGGGLGALLARSPGMALSDYLLARRQGRLVAALGIWDPHALKTTRVIGLPAALRAFSYATRALSAALPVPKLPRVGEELVFRYARHPAFAAGEEAALHALVRLAVNEARDRGDAFLLFTAADGDPLGAVTGGLPRTTYRYRMVAGTNRAEAEPLLERARGSLLYDDAALS